MHAWGDPERLFKDTLINVLPRFCIPVWTSITWKTGFKFLFPPEYILARYSMSEYFNISPISTVVVWVDMFTKKWLFFKGNDPLFLVLSNKDYNLARNFFPSLTLRLFKLFLYNIIYKFLKWIYGAWYRS